MEDALAFDSDVVASVIQNIDVLKDLLVTMMREQAPAYLPLTKGWDDKAKERAVVAFEDQQERETFFKFFRQLQNLYDILSPDASLHPYIADYNALAVLFSWIRQAYSDRVYVDREFTCKTKALLREHTQFSDLEPPTVIYELGPEALAALKDSDAPDTIKVLNLRKLIGGTVDAEGDAKPYLLSIGERAELIAELYDSRQISTQEALQRFEDLMQQTADADAKRRDLDLDENTFAIYTALNMVKPDVSSDQTKEVDAVFHRYPDYKWNGQQESQLRGDLYVVLLQLVGPDKMVAMANSLMSLARV